MVGHRKGQVGAPHRAPARAQAGKCLRAGDFMNKVAVDEDQSCTIGALFDDMRVPDFFIEGAGPGHAVHLSRLHNNASEWRSKRNFRSRWRAVPAKAGDRKSTRLNSST